MSRRLFLAPRQGDDGVALLTVVLVAAIMTALGLAVTKTAILNLDNAGRDRVAGGALGAAEAGVAGAITYIRGNGAAVATICATCTGPYNLLSPTTLTYPGGGQAVVTIASVQAYRPPVSKVGKYVIRSVGTSGSGPGKRTIEQSVDVKPFDFPLGIYTQAKINLGGNVSVQRESVFSGSCIDSRNKLSFIPDATGSTIDPYNDLPAGAHSASYITTSNSSVCSTNLAQVKATDVGAIHKISTCSPLFPADQDATPLGSVFPAGATGNTCRLVTAGRGDYATKGSEFSLAALRDTYGFLPRGLTDEQFALLKTKAKAANTWFPAGVTPIFPVASNVPGTAGYNPILYLEDQNLSLTNQLNGYAYVNDPTCANPHPSVLLIIERGSLNLASSAALVGNLFIPDGEISYSGGASLLGTMFSKDLKFTGNGTVGLNDCVAANTNGGILSINRTKFRQLDS